MIKNIYNQLITHKIYLNMKALVLFFLLAMSSNLQAQSNVVFLYAKNDDAEMLNDYSQRDREPSKRLLIAQKNQEAFERSTLITDSVRQYSPKELQNMSAENIRSIKIIKDEKDIYHYTDNKNIKQVILIKTKRS